MAEKILINARIKSISFADPITSAAGLDTATWVQQPLTLRDDELSIVEVDPDEKEIFSHENDTAEDFDVTGKGLSVVGSFVKATRAQMVELVGGETAGVDAAMKFHKSGRKLLLHKAIKFTMRDDSEVIVPNAKGFVNVSMNIGADGVSKFPFKFRCLVASADWDCDLIS